MKNLLLLVLFLSGCTIIEPGYVGIVVNQYGSNRGVQDYPVRVGMVFYNPISTSRVYEYPTFVMTAKWTATDEGKAGVDESITFSSVEGSQFSVDLGINYAFVLDSVPHVFVKYRKDPEHILDNIIRNAVREDLNTFAGKIPALGLVGPRKHELVDSVSASMRRRFAVDGIDVQNITLLSSPRPLDPQVQRSIDQAVQATNAAIAAENAVRRATAEAEQRAAQGKGVADSILVVANATAEANRKVASSLTPELVEYTKANKWDGKLPTVSGNAMPLINFKP